MVVHNVSSSDLYNRQLHPDERKLIGDKAHQMALDQAKNPEDVAKLEEYWTNVLTLVANADVDSQARQQLGSQLSQMAQAAQASGNTQAYQQFVEALQAAQQAIQGMAGQTITSNGGPIVADDGLLKTFQSTGSQFKDSSLFGTPGGTRLGLAIGETPASIGIDSQYYIAPNGPTNQQLSGFANDVLQQIGTANGSVTPVHPAEDVVLASMAGGLTSGAIKSIVGQLVTRGAACCDEHSRCP
jgi:filamentous hemagglutinin